MIYGSNNRLYTLPPEGPSAWVPGTRLVGPRAGDVIQYTPSAVRVVR